MSGTSDLSACPAAARGNPPSIIVNSALISLPRICHSLSWELLSDAAGSQDPGSRALVLGSLLPLSHSVLPSERSFFIFQNTLLPVGAGGASGTHQSSCWTIVLISTAALGLLNIPEVLLCAFASLLSVGTQAGPAPPHGFQVVGSQRSQSPATLVNKREARGQGARPNPARGHSLHSSDPYQGEPRFPSPPTAPAQCCPDPGGPTSSLFLPCRRGWAEILSTHRPSALGGPDMGRAEGRVPSWAGSRLHGMPRPLFLASGIRCFCFFPLK